MGFLQVAGLGIRLFALWILLLAAQTTATAVSLHSTLGSFTLVQAMAIVGTPVSALLLGIFLWRFPLAVARFLVPRISDTVTMITQREAWKLGCVLIGLLVLSTAIPLFIHDATRALLQTDRPYDDEDVRRKSDFVYACVKLGYGMFLVFGHEAIYRRFGRLPQITPESPADKA